MNALIHLDQNGKKVMERRVHDAVMKERADISTRAQYVWALSMLQCGLPQWYYVLGGIADRLPDNATLGSLFDGIGGFPYVWAQLHAGCKELCVWASEIEEFPIAVTKKWFPEVEDGKLF